MPSEISRLMSDIIDLQTHSQTSLKQHELLANTCISVYLQSSPTGPAEHCAGGSRPKSCNSCVWRY